MYFWVIIDQFENFDLQTALTGTVPSATALAKPAYRFFLFQVTLSNLPCTAKFAKVRILNLVIVWLLPVVLNLVDYYM